MCWRWKEKQQLNSPLCIFFSSSYTKVTTSTLQVIFLPRTLFPCLIIFPNFTRVKRREKMQNLQYCFFPSSDSKLSSPSPSTLSVFFFFPKEHIPLSSNIPKLYKRERRRREVGYTLHYLVHFHHWYKTEHTSNIILLINIFPTKSTFPCLMIF